MHPTLWNFDFSLTNVWSYFHDGRSLHSYQQKLMLEEMLFTDCLNQELKAWIDLVLYFIFFFPGVLALAFYGFDYAALAWKIKETSWNSPAQIQIYMAKSLIPLAGILLTIQGISEVFRSIICIKLVNGQQDWLLPKKQKKF